MRKRKAVIEDDVLVPAGQAAVIAVGTGVGGLAVLAVLTAWQGWPWWVAPAGCAVLTCVAFAISSVMLTLDHRRLLWAVERLTMVDLDADGIVGEPTQHSAHNTTPLVYVRDPRRERRIRDATDFRYFLRQAYDGRGTTWRRWKDVNLPSGRHVTRPIWEEYTSRLLRAGLAVREYDTAPLVLTSDYRDALATFREIL